MLTIYYMAHTTAAALAQQISTGNITVDFALINATLHDVRIRWAYPEHGTGVTIERDGVFKKIDTARSGNVYIGMVEQRRDGISGEAYKNFSLCRLEAFSVMDWLDKVVAYVRGVWVSLRSLLGL